MTMQYVEHQTVTVQGEVTPSNVAYLPLESIVDSYVAEIDGGRAELHQIDNEIAEVEQKLHLQRIQQLYKREIMAINLDIDESVVEMTLSDADSLLQAELVNVLHTLLETREHMVTVIEETRISQIRHEEAIQHRLFTTATSTYY